MGRQKELAIKVMELVNEFTHWNFQMIQEGNIYLVGTTLYNQKGQEMNVYYKIVDEKAQHLSMIVILFVKRLRNWHKSLLLAW